MGKPINRFIKRFQKTFSLDLKNDISVYYYNLIVTYVLCALSCIIVCSSIATQEVASAGITSQDTTGTSEGVLGVFQTIADSLIPTTVTFACSVVLQNLSVITRVGATNFPWSLALMFSALVYWGVYSAFRQITSPFKGIVLLLVSLFILFLCTISTIHCTELQQQSSKGSSLSA